VPDNFSTGMEEADQPSPPIAKPEMMSARYGISVRRPGSGYQEHLTEPYLMPSVHFRNGNMERVTPAIVHTPLGGMVSGPEAIAPAVPVDPNWGQPMPREGHGFHVGVGDGYPEGSPVPVM
jgi:hypothetical protein